MNRLSIGILFCVCGSLSACISTSSPETPHFYTRLDRQYAQINHQSALDLINAYRLKHGKSILSLNDKLNQAAQIQSTRMADAGQVTHAIGRDGKLSRRLKSVGYLYSSAAENIGAGYWTLAEAFSGWRDSPGHNKNMLLDDVSELGIATVYHANKKYKVFWTMIVASPKLPQPSITANR
ncbi:MAG: CAP domain-containing protein [Cohaesibacteraceae bacterium]|nr:CAP domain-containing protein [Cohaesibacteraceae bacterium]